MQRGLVVRDQFTRGRPLGDVKKDYPVTVFPVVSCLLGTGDPRSPCYLRFADILTRKRVLAVRGVEGSGL